MLAFREHDQLIYTCSRDGTVRRLKIVLKSDRDDEVALSEDKAFRLNHESCVMDMSVDDSSDRAITGTSGAEVALWSLATQQRG